MPPSDEVNRIFLKAPYRRAIPLAIFIGHEDRPAELQTTSGESNTMAIVHRSISHTKLEMEIGAIRGTPEILEIIKKKCFAGSNSRSKPRQDNTDKLNREFEAISHRMQRLDFYSCKDSLLVYLDNRLQEPGSKIEMPSTWDLSRPHTIYDTLQKVGVTTTDSKIHRAYGQIQLFCSVNEKAGSMLMRNTTLHNLACDKAGKLVGKEKDNVINSYRAEYRAGRRWLDIASWFGGTAIVFIFINAGMSSTGVDLAGAVSHQKTDDLQESAVR